MTPEQESRLQELLEAHESATDRTTEAFSYSQREGARVSGLMEGTRAEILIYVNNLLDQDKDSDG